MKRFLQVMLIYIFVTGYCRNDSRIQEDCLERGHENCFNAKELFVIINVCTYLVRVFVEFQSLWCSSTNTTVP